MDIIGAVKGIPAAAATANKAILGGMAAGSAIAIPQVNTLVNFTAGLGTKAIVAGFGMVGVGVADDVQSAFTWLFASVIVGGVLWLLPANRTAAPAPTNNAEPPSQP